MRSGNSRQIGFKGVRNVGFDTAGEAYSILQEDFRTLSNLPEVAERVGVSHDYLRHVFKAVYGIGLKEFLVQTRMERAEDLLLHSLLPIKAIAAQCGFATARYFCAVFRAKNNISPAQFRHQNAKRRNAQQKQGAERLNV